MKKATLVVPFTNKSENRFSRNSEDYEPKLLSGYAEKFDGIPLFVARDEYGRWWISDCGTGRHLHSYPYKYKKSALEACPELAKRLKAFWENRDSALLYDDLCAVRQEMKKRWEAAFPNDKENW